MPGIKTTYCARTADRVIKYGDGHWWCELTFFFASGSSPLVYGSLRGGGGISQPAIWHEHDPETEIFDKTLADAFIAAGVTLVNIEYPNFPSANVNGRHWPTYRSPHNWRFVRQAFQFMQTHALDGRITGSRSVTLPPDYRGYISGGISAGGIFAALSGLHPSGIVGYDDTYHQGLSDKSVYADGRVRGLHLQYAPSEFRIFDGGISGAGIQFAGVSERFRPDEVNAGSITSRKEVITPTGNRWDNIERDILRDIGWLETVKLDASENRAVGMFVDSSPLFSESSYLASGLIIAASGWTDTSGTIDTATTIETSVNGKGGAVKLVVEKGDLLYIYVEPNASTNSGFPDADVANDWTGTLTMKVGGSSVGTITSGAYQVSGSDNRKAFITRQAAVTAVNNSDYARILEISSPHHVIHEALVKYERDAIFAKRGLTSIDRYYLGSHYPAQISGDTVAFPYSDDLPSTALLDWFENDLGIDL